MNNERLAHVRANLRRRGLSQMLLVDPLSIWWLCGYYTEPYERFLALYVPCDEAKEPVMFSNRLFPRWAMPAPTCAHSTTPRTRSPLCAT